MCSKRIVKHPAPHLQPHLYNPICPHMPRFNVTAICTETVQCTCKHIPCFKVTLGVCIVQCTCKHKPHFKFTTHPHIGPFSCSCKMHAYVLGYACTTRCTYRCVSHYRTLHDYILTRFNVTGICFIVTCICTETCIACTT